MITLDGLMIEQTDLNMGNSFFPILEFKRYTLVRGNSLPRYFDTID